MMRSLYAGVSGLQNHQTRMDVIGNNISNVNTIGFKKGRVNFQDMLSQTMSGAARPTDDLGGVNPKQVGLGMTIAAIDTIHTQGSLQTTGVMTDIAIQGNGFFILREGDKEFYTRAGAFGLDEAGTLVNPANGLKVQGWMAQEVEGQTIINTASDVGDITIPIGGKDPASATSEVYLACNLDKRVGEIPADAGPAEVLQNTWTIDKTVYDDFGNTHTMRINFTKTVGAPNSWDAVVIMNPDADGADTANTLAEVGEANNATATFTVNFNNLGTLESVTDAQGDILTEGALQTQISFDVPDANPDAEGGVLRQTFNLNLGEVGSVVNSMTQFAEKSSTKAFAQNGYPMGYLESFKVDQSGMITGVYSNGTNRTIGQVALASFVNPGGLEKAGESTYIVTNNSGDPNVSESGVAGKGKFIAGALEMSNVDLAEQFTDMIVTQRGFQSNSKTIQTSDQMLQELLTLKR
ncbi:flagellar hook protein FlgE [Marispirochaeta aestuarii]|uniref:Flagellar hook protein FlgE n=1 Tax=Marispirochaeta aestuarii TaxID=1963862 RepID=A0A1Y1RW65_9SPIO|nr:flagellar hook protein FlgE [Marispirochaeta aestuarii]ORC34271.1 flagellar hook protein FlgE [Marispirochaeta aestuarii]